MNTVLIYNDFYVSKANPKFNFWEPADWELFVDTPNKENLSYGFVTSEVFVAKPTKRQIRKAKRKHRKEVKAAIEREKWNNSFEAIHCDIIGL